MLKKELDTPSLILDLEVFERNLVLMRDFAEAAFYRDDLRFESGDAAALEVRKFCNQKARFITFRQIPD